MKMINIKHYIDACYRRVLKVSYKAKKTSNRRLVEKESLKQSHLTVLQGFKYQPIVKNEVDLFHTFLYEGSLKDKKIDVEKFHNNPSIKSPLAPFNYALYLYNRWSRKKNNEDKHTFFEMIELANNLGENTDDGIVYPYRFPYPKYGLEEGWFSGICQAMACSCYLRAYNITKDSKYLNIAKSSLEFCFNNKSLKIETQNGDPWIEEYPSSPSSYVLNGFIFVIIATVEAEQMGLKFSISSKALIQSLFKNMHQYRYKNQLLYGLKYELFSSIAYRKLHNGQMIHLEKLTSFKGFNDLKVNV